MLESGPPFEALCPLTRTVQGRLAPPANSGGAWRSSRTRVGCGFWVSVRLRVSPRATRLIDVQILALCDGSGPVRIARVPGQIREVSFFRFSAYFSDKRPQDHDGCTEVRENTHRQDTPPDQHSMPVSVLMVGSKRLGISLLKC